MSTQTSSNGSTSSPSDKRATQDASQCGTSTTTTNTTNDKNNETFKGVASSDRPSHVLNSSPLTARHDSRQSSPDNGDRSVDPTQRSAGQQRLYDVIIFAASGSVGRFIVEEMALVVDKQYSSPSQTATHEQFAQHSSSRRRSVPSSSKSNGDIRWAVAGRSAVRLSEALCRAELSTGVRNLSGCIPVILADLNHQRSLLDMCEKASIVINCAGPYSDLGAEILIKACIECGTNYIDLAHESTFIEMISQKYSEQARRRGVFILNGCGFQSMSAEMGLNFTKQVADGRIEQVKIILSLSDTKSISRLTSKSSGIVSDGMWNSLLTEKAQEVTVDERLRLRAQSSSSGLLERSAGYEVQDLYNYKEESTRLMQQPSGRTLHGAAASAGESSSQVSRETKSGLLKRKDTRSLVTDIIQFRNRNVSALAWPLQFIRNFQSQQGRGYCWPVDNITGDESQLIRGEMNNYELRRPDFESSDGWRPIRYIMRKIPYLSSLGHVSTPSGSTRWLPGGGSFSLGNTQQQQIDRDSLNHIKYCQTFIAYGTPSETSGDPLEDRRRNQSRSHVQLLVARVVGPEPNHVATASLAIQAALTLFMERDHLPGRGGVLTPGAAFSDTNIIYQLRRRNIKFEVLKKA